MMKKVLSLVLALLMLLCMGIPAFAAKEDNTLRFDENGQFKILVFADIQSGYPVGDALIAFMREAMAETKPDLAILLGDNIMWSDSVEKYWKGYDEVMPLFEEAGVPFTLVFGNHDEESAPDPSIKKEDMLKKYQSYKGCLAEDTIPELHGCGTHNLPIYSKDGSEIKFNLWMMDSGDYVHTEDGRRYYDCVRKDQIDWYLKTSEDLEQQAGHKVPSLMFQHIVPQEVAQAVMPKLPFQLGGITNNFSDGTSYAYFIPNFLRFKGVLGEGPCPSEDNDGQWDAIANRGDVLSMFIGHDHVNTYTVRVKGVECTNVPGSTFKSYSSFTEHGATLLTLDEKDLSTFGRTNVYVSDLAVKEGSNIPNQEHSKTKAAYTFAIILRKILFGFLDALRLPFFWVK